MLIRGKIRRNPVLFSNFVSMKIPKLAIQLCALAVLLSSCATASLSKYKGVGRVKKYEIYSKDLPSEFDGFRIAFASDIHYKSKFTYKRLRQLVNVINGVAPDVLLLGGDYPGRADSNDIDTLFQYISKVKSRYGIYAVMGNHDTGKWYATIKGAMERYGIICMEDSGFVLGTDSSHIVVAGVKDSFDNLPEHTAVSQGYDKDDFVVLVSHTPDYAEIKDVSKADLVLSGHTHGGQVSLFKRIAPINNSKYGSRFLTGLKHNSEGVPMLITNGVGTSRKKVRIFTPSEVVLITLRKE